MSVGEIEDFLNIKLYNEMQDLRDERDSLRAALAMERQLVDTLLCYASHDYECRAHPAGVRCICGLNNLRAEIETARDEK